MRDRKIGLDSAIAGWAWATAIVMIVAMWITHDTRWGHTAMIAAAVAATTSVRAFIVQQCVSLHNAFQLGRDSVPPTPLQRR